MGQSIVTFTEHLSTACRAHHHCFLHIIFFDRVGSILLIGRMSLGETVHKLSKTAQQAVVESE